MADLVKFSRLRETSSWRRSLQMCSSAGGAKLRLRGAEMIDRGRLFRKAETWTLVDSASTAPVGVKSSGL